MCRRNLGTTWLASMNTAPFSFLLLDWQPSTPDFQPDRTTSRLLQRSAGSSTASRMQLSLRRLVPRR